MADSQTSGRSLCPTCHQEFPDDPCHPGWPGEHACGMPLPELPAEHRQHVEEIAAWEAESRETFRLRARPPSQSERTTERDALVEENMTDKDKGPIY